MTVFVKLLTRFQTDESGAITVDWVVLTSAIVGIAMGAMVTISGGINNASNNIVSGIGATSGSTSSTQSAEEITDDAKIFFDIGIAAKPNSRSRAWTTARDAAKDNPPDGYGYGKYVTHYIDTASGNIMFTSDDGESYSIGGEIVLIDDYPKSNKASFRSTFYDYWDESHP